MRTKLGTEREFHGKTGRQISGGFRREIRGKQKVRRGVCESGMSVSGRGFIKSKERGGGTRRGKGRPRLTRAKAG